MAKWVPVQYAGVDYSGHYEVNKKGVVRSVTKEVPSCHGSTAVKRSRIIKDRSDPYGYRIIGLTHPKGRSVGGLKTAKIHRIVLESFVGPAPDDMECRHLNGDRADNRLKNLRWGTKKRNSADRILHGTDARGSGNSRAKLTEDDVREIRRLDKEGWSIPRIAEKFPGVSQPTISHVITGYTWSHIEGARDAKKRVPKPKIIRKPRNKLNEDLVRQIRDMAKSHTHNEIAEAVGVSRVNVTRVVNRKTWKHVI